MGLESYDPLLVCFIGTATQGDTCMNYCASLDRLCIAAMDNVGDCGIGGGTPSCDAGQSRDECANGCNQQWQGQICGCGPAACTGLDVPAGDTICAAITGDWHSTIDKATYGPNMVCEIGAVSDPSDAPLILNSF